MTAVLIISGLLSGVIAGMGIGGGSILVPMLAVFTPLPQQEIQAINLAVFIPASIAALTVHVKNKTIDFSLSRPLIIYGLLGSAAGAFAALCLDGAVLRKIFAFFILFIGIFQLFKKDCR